MRNGRTTHSVDTGEVMVVCSKLLSRFPNVGSAVSTRLGGVSPEPLGMNLSFDVGDSCENVVENRRRFFRSVGVSSERVAFARQIHSDNVQVVSELGSYPSTDALVTGTRGLFLAISVADCLPIFLVDPQMCAWAAVHAGWKGSDSRIVAKTVRRMVEQFGSKPEDLVGYIGPAAGACCYEIGPDVAKLFPRVFLVHNGDLKQPHLDLKAFNRYLLQDAGLRIENIEVSEHCTICQPALFHSYRRQGKRSGRMLAIVGVAGEQESP